MSTNEAYPWVDDLAHHTERQFRRSWRGMPLRSDWNNRPGMMGCKTCVSCGYRWNQHDFTYRGNVLVNGQEPPVMVHERCWDCFMWDTQPERMERCFVALERGSVGTKHAPELKTLGGAR